MIIFQDFVKASDKGAFILSAINEYKSTQLYTRAVDAFQYFRGNNTTITNMMKWFYNSAGIQQEDKFKANHKVCSEFFKVIVMQENGYLLGNGLTVDDKIKKDLGKKFDSKLQKAGLKSLIGGVSWGYCFINNKGEFDIDVWDATEVVPFFDERTGAVMAVARFYQIESDRPMFVELYEQDGKTELMTVNSHLTVIKDKTPYRMQLSKDLLGEVMSGLGNFSVLPVFPLWANLNKESSLSYALKKDIDIYDIVMSDFANNLEDTQDIYWVLKNYQGQDLGEFLADYKYYKAIKVDGEGEATPHTIDIPYQARQIILEQLRKQIFEGAMALDISVLSGGSLTNVAINANMANLDLKTDDFETNVRDFVGNIIDLLLEFKNKSVDYEIDFIRRTIINDTEIIDNLMKSRSDLSLETFLTKHPYVDDVKKEIERIESEALSKVRSLDMPSDEEEV